MTAEVAVMNRIGIALAADSAVTIGREANKIYTSADKLFQLSNVAPIGVMIYGNASLAGTPWETIIKSYRRRLGDSTFGSVEDYAKNILSFITGNFELLPSPLQERQVEAMIASIFLSLREEMRERIDAEAEKKSGLSDNDLPPLLSEVDGSRLEAIRSAEVIHNLPDDHRDKIRTHFQERMQEIRRQVFGNLPIPEETEHLLAEMVVELLVREYFGPFKCGLVVAGFGEKEYSPTLISYELEEVVLGIPRKREYLSHKIDENSDGCILAFAQKDPVEHFLQGIDPNLASFMRDSTEKIVTGAMELVINKLSVMDKGVADQLRNAIGPEIKDMLKKLFDEWSARTKNYWQPVLNTVSALPKDELASMSEALVNLTKFRRRVTPERETVGGPIDVAVITRALLLIPSK